MFNLRYHIASLVAVFLALAIGLVLGGLVVRQGGFDRQQRALVSSLQSEYNKLKADNTSLKSSLSLESAYAKQMTDAWVAGRLAGSTVVVLTSGSPNEGADQVVGAVKSAGGSAAIVTIEKPNFALDESVVASSVAVALGTPDAKPTSAVVAKQLVDEWSGKSQSRALTNALVSAHVLKVTGLGPSAVATSAVDVATVDRDPDPTGLDVAAAYAAVGLYALGAETADSQSGVAAAAAARRLSAFDTLGTDAGRYTLVSLLTGGQQGYFSSTAHGVSAFPNVPVP
jgi:Copper transport outer membrane protein, MctB